MSRPIAPTLPLAAFFLCSLIALGAARPAAAATLRAGPLVGVPDMREAAVWVQTREAATVRLRYWSQESPENKTLSAPATTRQQDGYTATLVAGPLEPGRAYRYEVLVDGEAAESAAPRRFNTPPFFRGRRPPPDFQVAALGAHYVLDEASDPPFQTLGDGYGVFDSVLGDNPAFVLWLGNAVHLREPDWGSRSGIFARYAHSRAFPRTRALFSGLGHAAVLGEGEYGPQQADRYFWNGPHSREAFRRHWPHARHRAAGLESFASVIRWGDAEFFLLDDRSGRDLQARVENERRILDPAQLDWVIEAIRASRARFKIICMASPMLNPAESPEHFKAAPAQHERLMSALVEHRVDGVFFLTGGKPYGELTKVVRRSAPDVYELSVGPSTGRPDPEARSLNFYRVPGTSIDQRHYSLLRFEGAEEERQLIVIVKDGEGAELWRRSIPHSEMVFQ